MTTAAVEEQEAVMGVKEILEILPHRYPILLVDRVVSIDLEKGEIVGQKNVSVNEPFFQGHWPGLPIMPGVLILEALAQTGGILAWKKGHRDKVVVFLNMNNVKFRRPVTPGDVLMLHVSGLFFSSKGGKVKAQAKVGNRVVAEAEIGYALVDKNHI